MPKSNLKQGEKKMIIKLYGQSKYFMLTHDRLRAYFTLVEEFSGKKAKSFSIPNLTFSTIQSTQLSYKTAKAYGEIFLKVAELLKPLNPQKK